MHSGTLEREAEYRLRSTSIVCHADCARLVAEERYRYQFSLANVYACEPPVEEAKRRVSWLCSGLTADLTLPYYLPFEMRRMIARHLLGEYAVAKAISCWLQHPPPSDISVDVSTKVFARYTEFEGISYISSLTNAPGKEYELVYSPDPERQVKCVYVCENHLGIRQIHFSCGDQVPPVTSFPGAWWNTLQCPSPEAKVHGKTDGIKLRDLGWSEPICEPPPVSACAWELPLPVTTDIRLYDLVGMYPTDSRDLLAPLRVSGNSKPRMSELRYNDRGITGYSVCWRGGPVYIHCHAEEESLSFYNSPCFMNGTWLYMPLHQDELLVDIWIRRRQLPHDLAFVFRTNKGRIMTAGPQARSGQSPYQWTYVPGRLFFENSLDGILRIGLETTPPAPPKRAVAFKPLYPFPNSTTVESYFYSMASLRNEVEVTPCRCKTANTSAVIGLLLRYANGYQTSVGEIQLNLLEDTVQVGQIEKMTLEFSTIHRFPYVSDIYFSHAESSSALLLDIYWTGYLEWWHSQRQCMTCCNGQRSPLTRM
ncbi:hypothetical protein GGR52DRAFT_463570 [Hypoxylon sp. FL1284]|nr:hypothetical protein GGR52DRAFT_463570 [Hypoxylon sp. FL1284]